MKYMNEVETNVGRGTAVARTKDGGLLATISKDQVKGRACLGPCLNVLVRWCEEKKIWCEGNTLTPTRSYRRKKKSVDSRRGGDKNG